MIGLPGKKKKEDEVHLWNLTSGIISVSMSYKTINVGKGDRPKNNCQNRQKYYMQIHLIAHILTFETSLVV